MVQDFERTPPDKYVRWVNVTRALVCGLPVSRAVCPVLMRSTSCRYPVCISCCSFNLSCEWSTTGHVTEFPGRVPHVHSVIVQPTFCPLFIRYIFVLSVINLFDRSLSVTCSVRMRSLRLARRSSPQLRRLPSPDKHFFFAFFFFFFFFVRSVSVTLSVNM